IQMEIHLEETTYLFLNKESLEKVLSNILSNAIHYTAPNKRIRIKISENEINIENECEPLSDDVLSQIFKAFYRPDFSRNKKDGGTGLGLYIVQDILTEASIPFTFTQSELGMKFVIVGSNEK